MVPKRGHKPRKMNKQLEAFQMWYKMLTVSWEKKGADQQVINNFGKGRQLYENKQKYRLSGLDTI